MPLFYLLLAISNGASKIFVYNLKYKERSPKFKDLNETSNGKSLEVNDSYWSAQVLC